VSASTATSTTTAGFNILDDTHLTEDIIFKFAIYVSNHFKFSFLNTTLPQQSLLPSSYSSSSSAAAGNKYPFLSRTINVTKSSYLKSLRNSKQNR
jgi:hypothetical protein